MRTKKVTIAAILTCHNRIKNTLTCLKNLMNQEGISNVELNIYLVDDGSTDGTSDSVGQYFPQVNVLKGDGTLYWNGGMRFAFSEAMKNDYDYYLWLNNDTFIFSDAIKLLLDTSNNIKQKKVRDVIVTGTIRDVDTKKVNYGGKIQKSKLEPLNFIQLESRTEPQRCDTFNGNVVLIPRNVVKIIGNISLEYSKQHNGDLDYGLRAKYAGFDSWVAQGFIGECASNATMGTHLDTTLSIKKRLKIMKTPHGLPPTIEWMIFTKRHAGLLWPFYWIRTIIRILFPWIYLYLRKPL